MSSFAVQHGEFVIPDELLDEAHEAELGRYFAEHLPPHCSSIRRSTVGGVTRVRWARVRFLGWRNDDGTPALGA